MNIEIEIKSKNAKMKALRKVNIATNSRIKDEFTNYKTHVINKIKN